MLMKAIFSQLQNVHKYRLHTFSNTALSQLENSHPANRKFGCYTTLFPPKCTAFDFQKIPACIFTRQTSDLKCSKSHENEKRFYSNDYKSRRVQRDNYDGRVAEDTLIFSYYDNKFFRSLSFFGSVLTFLMASQAYFTYTDSKLVPEKDIETPIEQRNIVSKILSFGRRNQWTILSCLYSLVAVCAGIVAYLYTKRSVRELWLLKYGEKVKLVTYNLYGRQNERVLDLVDISFQNTRATKGSVVVFKVKDKMFYHMLDKRKGEFHEPKIFDFVICMRREL